MFCTACGVRNADLSNFCKQCGHKLDHTGAPKISEEAYDRALPMEEQASALLERAYRLRKSGELAAAVSLCEEALRLNAESTSVHSLLGQIHEQMGKRDAAIHEYERVLQINPGSIADRVKLDELRGDGLPSPLHLRSAPHIVMSDRSLPNPNGRQMLGIAGVAGVLMLLGGLLTLQFLSHQEKNSIRPAGGSARSTTGTGAPQTEARSNTASDGTNASSGVSNEANRGAVGTNVSSPANVGLPVNPTYSPNASYSQPPVYIPGPQRVVYVERGSSEPPSSRRNGGGLPNLVNLHPQAGRDGDSERMRLPDSSGQYIIPISASGGTGEAANSDNGAPSAKSSGTASGRGAGTAPSPKAGTFGGKTGSEQGKITVHKHGDGGSADNSISPPATEAQSQLAIASSKYKNGDFEGAIKMYRSALSGAGSQTAYVYQQMGICFQKIKNQASAIDNFNSAITEYQKLESANQQVDLARVGIRVCENGIKLCKAE